MTTTVQQAFRPLFITCFIIGLCVYPLNSPKSRVVYLSVLYSAIVWFVYGYLLYCMMSSLSLEALFPYTITLILLEVYIIATITSVIFNIYYNKRIQMCMERLTTVDDTLKELGSPKIYRKMYMLSKQIAIGWTVFIFALNFGDTMSWLLPLREKTTLWRFIIPHMYNYCIHTGALVDLVFITFLWYIGTRFDEVKKHMQNLLVRKEHWLRNTWKKPTITVHQCTLSTDNFKRVLWSSIHLHLEICRIAREWNLVFGIQMAAETASYPLFGTSMCFYIYKLLTHKQRNLIPVSVWFRVISWTFMFVGKVYIINYICENVSVKANKIDKIINELTLPCADVLKEIYQFNLQTMHHPLEFTGMGFFSFGNKFFIKFCVAITTFLIIVIQMSNA
ncbi:putative gustatory receptor 28b [Temnothorax nylanderi]|uniref:putative gustatory receptor 28b n=1 Tax=Temnothorax nylanderi TaxID=102681 RepID=UPI003A886790